MSSGPLGFIAPTDRDWFTFLSSEKGIDEVNFWQPGGGRKFHAISPGAPFFFKLKAPINMIGGFGYLSRAEILPAWLAWETFGRANGAATYEEMRRRIDLYRKRFASGIAEEPKIGCLMIVDPVFFPEEDWVKQPSDWHANIVSGATYPLGAGEGRRVFEECQARSMAMRMSRASQVASPRPRYGEPTTMRPRLGQGSFRLAVLDAYGSCAITTEHSLPVLEAAHIMPYGEGGDHRVSNGLLLRSDIHKLFDRGYVTISSKMKFEVSGKLKADFANGKSYYELHGRSVAVIPAKSEDQPDPAMLHWHNSHKFKG